MPAYFSVEINFKSNIIYPNLVRDVYSTFFTNGFNFKSGYWYGENNSLEEIVDWNQKLLEKGFELGYSQHVKHDYKQILLDTELFEEMRLFWMFSRKQISSLTEIPFLSTNATLVWRKMQRRWAHITSFVKTFFPASSLMGTIVSK